MTFHANKKHFTKAQIFLGLLVFGAAVSAGPVFAQDRDVQNRLNRMENEIETLGRAVYKGETPPPGAFAGSTSNADVEVRIQGFETEIRALTGKIEEQDYQIRQLKEQLERLSTDIEVRGQNNGGGAGGFTTGGSIGSMGGSTGGSFGVEEPAGTMQYQDRTATPPQPAPSANDPGGYQWNSGNASETGGQLGTYNETNNAGAGSSGDTAAALYESAFALLKAAQYNEAEKEFNSFLTQYPDHVLGGNATYWLGETYYVRGQFEKAAKTFAEGYKKDPKGAKAADNLLKMGMSLSGMKKKPEACVALAQIEKEFPGSAAPVLRRAQQEMTRLGC